MGTTSTSTGLSMHALDSPEVVGLHRLGRLVRDERPLLRALPLTLCLAPCLSLSPRPHAHLKTPLFSSLFS